MSNVTLGLPEAHEKLTGRIFYKRRREKGYIDAGNVLEYADASTQSLVTRVRTQQGARYVNDEQGDIRHDAWSCLLDERDENQEKLLRLAGAFSTNQQAAVEGATATLEDVVAGRWFMIGAYNIANVSVTASDSGAQEEGTDYELDKSNGRLRVIPDAGIADGEDLTVTFDEPQINFRSATSQVNPLFYCDFIIEETNQYDAMSLRRMAFWGYLNILEFPAQTGEFGKYRVKVTPGQPVTFLKRPTAETLPTIDDGNTPANSSSSQSNSSSSSGHSSSSSSS